MSALLALAGGFASGIFLRSFFVVGWGAAAFLFFLAVLFGCARWRVARGAYASLALFFLAATSGVVLTASRDTPPPTPFASEVGAYVSYEGVVIRDPDVRDANQRIVVRVTEKDVSTNVLVVAQRSEQVAVGDRVTMFGTLSFPEPFEGDNGRVFRYDTYLEKDGIRFMIPFGAIEVTAPAPWWSVPAALARVKHFFIRGLEVALPEPHASLASGMLVGGKQGLGSDLLAAFTAAGIVHIIVLSGYNVMIIAQGVMAVLARFRISRAVGAAAGGVAILIFVGIAGAGSATIRAMLMALIALYARATGRTYVAGRALIFVAALMLVINPLLLAFDPGFVLSLLATAGLIWLTPLVEQKLVRVQSAFWRDMLATTIAAQVAVLPFLLYQTGNLSLVAFPVNMLVLPVIPLAMAASAIAGFAGALFGLVAFPLTLVFGFPAYALNAYIIKIAEIFAELPGSAVLVPTFPFWIVVGAYALLVYGAHRAYKKIPTTGVRGFDGLSGLGARVG